MWRCECGARSDADNHPTCHTSPEFQRIFKLGQKALEADLARLRQDRDQWEVVAKGHGDDAQRLASDLDASTQARRALIAALWTYRERDHPGCIVRSNGVDYRCERCKKADELC